MRSLRHYQFRLFNEYINNDHIVRGQGRKLNFQFTARNDRILSERVRRSEADAGASLKFYHSGRHTV